MTDIIRIDGSMLEGGGSIVRNTIALSAILQKPVEIFNIRAKRSKPGLRNQHTFVIRSISEMCNADITGANVGSSEVTFFPGRISGGEYKIDVQTAGSITLVLQALIPVAVYAPNPTKFLLKGGTDVPMSPPLDYFRFVYLPMMERLGLDITLCSGRRGHYPRGGGILSCDINPIIRLNPITYKFEEHFKIERINAKAHAVQLPSHIADRMISSADEELRKYNYTLENIERDCPEPKYDAHLGPGTGIFLWAYTNYDTILAGDCLGEKGLPAEEVGKIAAKRLLEQIVTQKPIDYHLSDQLVLWMSLSQFPSIIDTTKISLHTLTNIEIAKKFTRAEFTVNGQEGKPGTIFCEPTSTKKRSE
ncbi:MAG: RNA 3'-terminal phosphate cyclase [Candidatus Heimdallarchaeota archaeon]|nr:RNA 3'-terminal phosphate cyclase [Candidatus Heimdallarchaeota archaeon]